MLRSGLDATRLVFAGSFGLMPQTTTTTMTVTVDTENETTPKGPRRSQRSRKQTESFIIGGSQSSSINKRKRQDLGSDDEDEQEPEEEIEIPQEDDDDDAVDEYAAPRKAKTPGRPRGRPRGPPAVKKVRATKAQAKTTSTRKGKKKAQGDTFNPAKITQETKLSDDNPLFNAIMNPSSALQSVVEDFLESLSQSPSAAFSDLINCILRSCGCNDSVDADRAVDYDGIVDALDDFTEALKGDDSPTYPLTSKLPAFKKFRKSLSEFLHRLVASSAELGSLYTTDLLPILQAWVVAMSSSHLRSFRHTATTIALELETALSDVAAAVEKEAEIVTRQREGEKKRKGKGANTGREKEIDKHAAEVKVRRAKVTEFLAEFFDGVFVHRYRDLDPNIRAECVHALGMWIKKFPAQFLDGQYLRYIGWVLSDVNTHVRLEAVKSLVSIYSKDDFIVSLHHFTERFKPRLVEMATGDTELTVRVAVIQALGSIDTHGLLDEEQRQKLCLLIFDEESKVRKAVAPFVKGVWEEAIEQRLVGRKETEDEKKQAGVKALALLLVRWSRALDRESADVEEDGDLESNSEVDPPRASNEVAFVVNPLQKGRIALAVEALWDDIEAVNDWEALLDLLLLDHSARREPDGSSSPVMSARRKKASKDAEEVVDEAWRLEEVEEALLLEVLVTVLRKSLSEAAGGKKSQEDEVISDITRALIKGLPNLFLKHQTDERKVADVLLLPTLMNIDLFLEMRMITAYEALWDDVMKQFLSHSSSIVLSHSMAAIIHLMNATSISNTNSTKILELEDELSTSLRDAVAEREDLDVATFSDDEARSLGAVCARIATIVQSREMTAWMDESEGGKQSSIWDILSALADRGRLGYKEEEMMIERALHSLTLHVIWKARPLIIGGIAPPDSNETFREQRDSLLEKLIEYAIGKQSNPTHTVKRVAFQNLMTLYCLFSSPVATEGAEDEQPLLALTMDDEVQYRCAGFIQAEIERYAEELENDKPSKEQDNEGDNSDSDVESDIDETEKTKQKKNDKNKRKQITAPNDVPKLTRRKLEQEFVFNVTVSSFLRAIRMSVIHIRHGSVLLAHYGRLGSAFDSSIKILVDNLREEGMYKDNGELVSSVCAQAIRDSFTLVLDRIVDNEIYSVALAKSLSSCIAIRGAQLAIVKRLPGQHVVDIHTTLISWIMKRIAMYESNNEKRLRSKAVLLFRVLMPLLLHVESRDALTIKAQLEQAVAQAKIEVSPNSKGWEPYRTYEKRLSTIMSKNKAKSARGKVHTTEEVVTSDGDDEIEVQDLMNEPNSQPLQPVSKPRPKPRPANRQPSPSEGSPHANNDIDLDAENLESEAPAISTPRAPRVNGSRRSPSPLSSVPPQSRENTPTPSRSDDGSVSRKRARSPDANTSYSEDFPEDDPAAVIDRTEADLSEMIIRRKRVRH